MVNHTILCNVIKTENDLVIVVKLDSDNPIIYNSLILLLMLGIVYPLICSPAFSNSSIKY